MARFELGLARLTAKGRRWHATGHPWVYRDDLYQVEAGRGLLVRVEDDRGRGLGLATFSPESKIALRFVEPGAEAEVGDRLAWFERRLQQALARRQPLRAVTDAFRLVSSEADGLPGLIVDVYADVVVLQSLTPFVEEHLDHVVPALVSLLSPRMVLARNDARVRELEGLPRRVELCHGTRVDAVTIREHGLELRVDPWRGQKTGFFLDQRPARALVGELAGRAPTRGGRVLDVCCYTGGFTLQAARGGAASVVAVDTSEAALAEVTAAAARNGLAGIETRRGKAGDVFRELLERGEPCAGIVLDPPAFARSAAEVEAAWRGYVDLNRHALELLVPGGWLVTCSCSYNIRPEMFRQILAEAAARAGRRVLDRGRLLPALDHPVLVGLPESDYLKVHWLEVAD